MSKQSPGSIILVGAIAAGIAFTAFVALMVLGGYSISAAAFLAILVALTAAIFLFRGFHSPPEQWGPADTTAPMPKADPPRPRDLSAEATRKSVPGAAGEGASPVATALKVGSDTSHHAGSGGGAHIAEKATGGFVSGLKGEEMPMPAGKTTSGDQVPTDEKTTTGDGMTGPGSEQAPGGHDNASGGQGTGASHGGAGAAAPSTDPAQGTIPAAASDDPAATEARPDAQKWTPSTPLAGEAELGERKGNWRYEKGASEADAGGNPVPTETPRGPAESVDVGKAPERLDGPRDGSADDLKMIKGVGPKLEELLHHLGFYHFDQVASWTDEEVTWVDHNLEGFKGRVSRDEWVSQAKILAAGGSTEFSQRAEDGAVH